jgi:hypothetical protein
LHEQLIVRELIFAADGSECALTHSDLAMRNRTRYALLLIAVGFAQALAACTSTQTSTTASASSTQKCQFRVTTSSSSFSDGGGTGSLAIDTTRDCTWAVSSNASWVLLPDSTGQGGASVSYTVAANTVPQTRVANLSVEGQTLQLSQAAAPCRFTLSSSGESVGYAGGTLSVTVQTFSGCGWATASDSGWLTVISNASGSSTAAVGFRVAANPGPARVGRAAVGGQPFTVMQDGAPTPAPGPGPTPTPTPTPSPTPTPTPVPVPVPTPVPTPTTISGTARNVSGHCPDVSFTVNGTPVDADKATKFGGGKCDGVKNGTDVSVTGLLQNGTISATAIQILKD